VHSEEIKSIQSLRIESLTVLFVNFIRVLLVVY